MATPLAGTIEAGPHLDHRQQRCAKTTTIFETRKIITMNPSRPLATRVAVRDGRILGVGALDELPGGVRIRRSGGGPARC